MRRYATATCPKTQSEVDWMYLSPPMPLEPGPRTGHCRLGADDLVAYETGASRISTADFAIAQLDEAECPKHSRTRFTVAY
jgi:putative NADH-flavin reductase